MSKETLNWDFQNKIDLKYQRRIQDLKNMGAPLSSK